MKFHIEPGSKWPYVLEQPLCRTLYGAWLKIPATNKLGRYVEISVTHKLYVRAGYRWDGPSGPAVDTMNFARASLFHDALYQLIREGEVPYRPCRWLADKLMREVLEEDGMNWLRRWVVWSGVRLGGWRAAKPKGRV